MSPPSLLRLSLPLLFAFLCPPADCSAPPLLTPFSPACCLSASRSVTEELGFLPKADPSTSLLSRHLTPSPAAQALFRSWEDCASQLPSLLCAGSVRKRLAALPSPEDCGSSGNSDAPPPWAEPLVADEGQAERAMLLLSFFAHAWVWGEEPVAHSLPANISRPWVEVAWVVGRPPILTYYSFNACNWRRLDPSGPVALGNTCRSLNFLGGRDEEWFSAVHVAIEAKAGAALLSSVRAQREVSSAAAAGDLRMSWGPVAAELEGIAGTVRGMLGILKRMKVREAAAWIGGRMPPWVLERMPLPLFG